MIYIKFSEFELVEQLFVRSDSFWLVIIIFTQLATYYFIALNYRDVLRIKKLNVSVRELISKTFVIQFLNQALPSAGFSGQVFFVSYLRKFGLTITEGIGRAILELVTLIMAFGTFFIVSASLLFRGDVLGHHPEARLIIYGFTFIATLFLLLFFMLQKNGRGRIAGWVIERAKIFFEKRNKNNGNGGNSNGASYTAIVIDQFKSTLNIQALKKHKDAFWSAYAWQLVVLLLDVLTLYFIAIAIGYKITFSLAFIAFTLTQFLSMISFIPGALGIFEGGMTLILISFGVHAEPAFAMTLLLRAFTFWFPMPIGWILYRLYIHRQELEHPYENLPTGTSYL